MVTCCGKEESEYGNWRCHEGFYRANRSVDKGIRNVIHDHPDRKIVLTGHSLGGALAAELATTIDITQYLITFGQPCIGGALCARELELNFLYTNERYIRVVNGSDAVPRLLENRFGYHHAGELLYISNEGKPYLNPTKWFMYSDRVMTWLQRSTDHSGKEGYYVNLLGCQKELLEL